MSALAKRQHPSAPAIPRLFALACAGPEMLSMGALSGDIGSAGGGTDLFPSTPSLDHNEH